MNSGIKNKLVNAGLFQLGWFSCIMLPTYAAVAVSCTILAVHLISVPYPKSELLFILIAAFGGYAMDFSYSLTGMIDLNPGEFSQLYLVCVWLLFSMTLNWSMNYALKTPWRAALLGLLAPLSYYAAQQFGRVKYSQPLYQSMGFHALLWAHYMLIVHKLKFSQNSQCVNER